MKRFAASILVSFLSLTSLRAGNVSQELNLDYSFVGGAATQFTPMSGAHVSSQSSLFHYVLTKQIGDGPLIRVGTEWQRFTFTLPSTANIPDTLQSNSLILGMDLELYGWLVRIEAQPGFYGDARNMVWNDFNVPFIIGGTYIVSGDLQWIAGIRVDFNSQFPVFGALGVRWKFADKWVLNGILPKPRIEYEMSDAVTLYAGAEIKDGTFRVNRDFGNMHGNPGVNAAYIDYYEVRAGVGASWKVSSNLKLDVETGYMPYRDFNFHRADVDIETNGGAAYGQISLGSQF